MDEQIFKDIASLVTTTEFSKAQDDFFEKNQDKFEDTEENKLEYTNIYTEYVYILEEVIEINLKDKYTDEQIEAFYASFGEKMPLYKQINPTVVDSLFDFIDFEKFKKSILISKNMLNEGYQKGEKTAVDQAMASAEVEKAAFKGYMQEELSSPWYQALVQKEVEGHSSISHQRPCENRPLNIVRTKSTWKNIDVELVFAAM